MDYERFKEGFQDALKAELAVRGADVELTARRVDKMNESYLDMETMNIVNTQMYIDGYQVKLVSDTSYGSLWEVSFMLKEF
jgi:hypothetical protein